MYRTFIKPLFFLLSPEKAHYAAMGCLKTLCRIPGVKSLLRSMYQVKKTELQKQLFGIQFPNPVGLAAGFDKDARWVDELECLGFGFVEIGTVTPLPQPGNDQPRLFRLPQDEALINRMGFNNAGAIAAAERLKKRKSNIIIGGNIGKNKVTPNEDALSDYVKCMRALHDVVDYFVVNVSSPNTPGLRALQEKEPLLHILANLQKLNTEYTKPKPILLKIAPDLTNEQLDDIIDIVKQSGIAGVIATNTTISRDGLTTPKSEVESIGAGGLSGIPLRTRSTEVIRYLKSKSNNAFPVIGVGGIHSPADAIEKIEAGADMVQVYTGFIYEGPGIAKRINREIGRLV
ncbi:MAG: quinone-dependent dihydroorotate dehydrogenase [Flavobacteriales bacterium]|nr:quinone-dependent dihydroorotate dehydrogenase [Flavobacteriales bacterium]